MKKNYSSDEYNKLSPAQKNAIREVRLKYKANKQKDNNTLVSSMASTLGEGLSETIQKAVIQGVRNATNNNSNSGDSRSNLTPTQQLMKCRKVGDHE